MSEPWRSNQKPNPNLHLKLPDVAPARVAAIKHQQKVAKLKAKLATKCRVVAHRAKGVV
jgi:hypothetical protein